MLVEYGITNFWGFFILPYIILPLYFFIINLLSRSFYNIPSFVFKEEYFSLVAEAYPYFDCS